MNTSTDAGKRIMLSSHQRLSLSREFSNTARLRANNIIPPKISSVRRSSVRSLDFVEDIELHVRRRLISRCSVFEIAPQTIVSGIRIRRLERGQFALRVDLVVREESKPCAAVKRGEEVGAVPQCAR